MPTSPSKGLNLAVCQSRPGKAKSECLGMIEIVHRNRIHQILGSILGCVIILIGGISSLAGQAVRETSSLSLVPENAAFYYSTLNNGDKWNAFINSRAFFELSEMPITQFLIDEFMRGYGEGSNADFDDAWQQMSDLVGEEQLQGIIDFSIDVLANETFVYGGEGFCELLELSSKYSSELDGSLVGGASEEELQQAAMQMLSQFIEEDLESVQIPDVVIGFRVTDAVRAREHVNLVHGLVTLAMLGSEVPLPIRRGYLRRQIGEGEYLTLKLTGELLPWDDLMIGLENATEVDTEWAAEVIDQLKAKTLTVAVGTFEDYVIISIGDSTEHLETLGSNELLVDRDEFAPLREDANEKFAEIYYLSDRFASAFSAGSYESLLPTIPGDLYGELAANLPNGQSLANDIRTDLQRLGQQMDSISTDPGATIGYSYFVDGGFEGYEETYSVSPFVDGSRPLTILQHVDSSPLMFFAGREAYRPEDYSDAKDWVVRADWYIEEYFRALMSEADYAQYAAVRDSYLPLLVRFDRATEELMIPATQDGQYAIVFDFRNAKRQWDPVSPPAEYPVPFPEFALVLGLSDAEKFAAATDVYDELFREIYRQFARSMGSDFPPELALDAPKTQELANGTAYYYANETLDAFGLSDALRLNMAMNDEFAAFSLTTRHAQRLLTPSELPSDGPFAKQHEPMAAAFALNFYVLVDALHAWYRYADQMGAFDGMADLEGDLPFPPDDILSSFETLMEVARCFRGVHAVTTIENGKTVTRSRMMFEDMPW